MNPDPNSSVFTTLYDLNPLPTFRESPTINLSISSSDSLFGKIILLAKYPGIIVVEFMGL